MTTVFLLGSGISMDAGMPDVPTITRQVLSGEGAFLSGAHVFLLDADNPNYERLRPPVERVLKLVSDLCEQAHSYYGRLPTYEEVSQLVRQISDALSGEYESAAVMPLVAELAERDYASGDYGQLGELTALTSAYIADTVWHMLDKPAERLDHLQSVLDACVALGRVDLATLNHDLVLESALDAQAIHFSDGFDATSEDVRLWTDEWLSPVRLLKLHGSVDWWAYQIEQQPWRGWITGRYRGDDAIHPRRAGLLDYPHDLRPVILTGTFDKILAYETWIFPDQHLRFHEGLRQASRVVTIGYGFGDKAINTRLIGWLARQRENKLIVCHGAPDELRIVARGAIRAKWSDWCAANKLTVIPVWVADLRADELCAALAD
jgi:hypothetical protein